MVESNKKHIVKRELFETDPAGVEKTLAELFEKSRTTGATPDEIHRLVEVIKESSHEIKSDEINLFRAVDQIYREEAIKGKADHRAEAIESRFLPLEDLARELGTDETYDSILGHIFEKFECQKRNPNPPNTIVMWTLLLQRWSSGGHDAASWSSGPSGDARISLKPFTIGYLPLYRYNYTAGNFDKKPSDKEASDFFNFEGAGPRYLNLEDLKQYFTEKLKIPLPSKLYPKEVPDPEAKRNCFPCENGTSWHDIRITLIDQETAKIKTPEGEGRFTYHQLGMSDRRSGNKPTLLWALLNMFAKNQGYISRHNKNYHGRLPDTAKRLNKHLQKLFNIDESIFTGHYKSENGYKTKIFFSDKTSIS